jgi:hypothetical protein
LSAAALSTNFSVFASHSRYDFVFNATLPTRAAAAAPFAPFGARIPAVGLWAGVDAGRQADRFPKEGATMAKLVLPRVHVMVLCDAVEPSPGEEDVFDLRGVRTFLRADAFPYVHPQICIYLQVSGHEGTTSGHVTFSHAATDEQLLFQPIEELQFEGPLVLRQVPVQIVDCAFPEAGLYYVQVFFGSKLVAERPLWLLASGGFPNGQASS